jgi:hypothetical protein
MGYYGILWDTMGYPVCQDDDLLSEYGDPFLATSLMKKPIGCWRSSPYMFRYQVARVVILEA